MTSEEKSQGWYGGEVHSLGEGVAVGEGTSWRQEVVVGLGGAAGAAAVVCTGAQRSAPLEGCRAEVSALERVPRLALGSAP